MIRAALLTTALMLIPSPMSSQEAHGFRIEEGQRVTTGIKAKRRMVILHYRHKKRPVHHRAQTLAKPELPRSPVQSAEQPATGAALPVHVPVAENFNETWAALPEPMPVMEAWTIVEHPVAFKNTQRGKLSILVGSFGTMGLVTWWLVNRSNKGVKHVG